jgi:two-component sensor histidine kinase/PAS domain-containing protein
MASDIASSLRVWPVGGGETGVLIRARDWSRTPLGDIAQWPERLRAAVDNCLDAAFASFVWWGPELIQFYNDPARAIMQAKHRDGLGVPAPEAWFDFWTTIGPAVERVMSTGRPVLGERMPLAPGQGEAREFNRLRFSYSALRDDAGFVAGILVSAVETAESVCAKPAPCCRTSFDAMDEGYLLADVIFDEAGRAVDIECVDANPAAIRVIGDDMTGCRVSECGVDYEPYWYDIWGRVARTGQGERLERYAAPLKRWFDFFVFKPAPNDRESRRVGVVFQDVTERRNAETALRHLDVAERVWPAAERARAVAALAESEARMVLMVAELQHRTRNLIAVVRSIISHTLASSPSPEEFKLRIDDRLSALSRVQGLLSRAKQEPITIGLLVRGELDALGGDVRREQVDIAGPEVRLRSSMVQTLALALHELATNARKYGALSTERGRLRIAWRLERRRNATWLMFSWVEENAGRTGPLPCPKGYGRELIEQALPYSHGADTRYELDETGLRCSIALPLGMDARQERRR